MFSLLPEVVNDLNYFGRDRFSEEYSERFDAIIQLLAISAYDLHIAKLRDQWDTLRYEAILSPSIQAFRSLIGLRRQITHNYKDLGLDFLRHEVLAFESATTVTQKEAETVLDFLKLHGEFRYDARDCRSIFMVSTRLVRETDSMRDNLNDNIQLAIGAATIQDSDAMKQQAERRRYSPHWPQCTFL